MNTLFNLFVSIVYAAGDLGGKATGGDASDNIIGNIALPSGIPQEVNQTTGLISALIRFIIIVAGVFSLWQFISGGLSFITSGGDKGKLTEAQNKIQMSLIGLVIIAGSFLIIAIISQILFGSFTAILIPKLTPINAP